MGFFSSAKCLFGLHDWSDWKYGFVGHCEQRRYCKRERCRKGEVRIAHNWSVEEYVAPDSCETHKTCNRCGEVETSQAPHDWSPWVYTSGDDCLQGRMCERCGEVEGRVEHIWSAWQYESPDSCTKVRNCLRCRDAMEERVALPSEHRWGPMARLDCQSSQQVCARCGEARIVEHGLFSQKHRYGTWRQVDAITWRRTCKDCGHSDEECRVR